MKMSKIDVDPITQSIVYARFEYANPEARIKLKQRKQTRNKS